MFYVILAQGYHQDLLGRCGTFRIEMGIFVLNCARLSISDARLDATYHGAHLSELAAFLS